MICFHGQEPAGPGPGRRGEGNGVMGRHFLCAALTAVLTTAIVQPTSAQKPFTEVQQVTGNKFLEVCRGGNTEQGFCWGYFTGVSDGIAILQTSEGLSWQPICKPRKVTTVQLRDVVIKYIDDHPEERHNPIIVLTILAMRSAWPCSP